MTTLVRPKWLDNRKWLIDGRMLKWKWSSEERKQWKKDNNCFIEEWIEYPSDDALEKDLNCYIKIKYYKKNQCEREKLIDVGYRYPNTLRRFLLHQDLMNENMERWIQSNVIKVNFHFKINDILYLKEVDKNTKKDRIVIVTGYNEPNKYIFPFMDGVFNKYEVKHISFDKNEGIKLLKRLANGQQLHNNGRGWVSEDDVHRICTLDDYAYYNIRIFLQAKEIQLYRSHCVKSAEYHVGSVLYALKKWLSIKYINSSRHTTTTLPDNQKKNEFDPLLRRKGYNFAANVFMNGVKTQQIYQFDYDDLKEIYGDDIIKIVLNGPDRISYSIVIYDMELRYYLNKTINNLKITASIKQIIH